MGRDMYRGAAHSIFVFDFGAKQPDFVSFVVVNIGGDACHTTTMEDLP